MPMSPYTVVCTGRGCTAPAAYKIASRWSDGATHELKTYALVCPGCLPGLLAASRVRRAACHLAPGESLDEPVVYEITRGRRDAELTRRRDLETV
jgi:hypothetical protein